MQARYPFISSGKQGLLLGIPRIVTEKQLLSFLALRCTLHQQYLHNTHKILSYQSYIGNIQTSSLVSNFSSLQYRFITSIIQYAQIQIFSIAVVFPYSLNNQIYISLGLLKLYIPYSLQKGVYSFFYLFSISLSYFHSILAVTFATLPQYPILQDYHYLQVLFSYAASLSANTCFSFSQTLVHTGILSISYFTSNVFYIISHSSQIGAPSSSHNVVRLYPTSTSSQVTILYPLKSLISF